MIIEWRPCPSHPEYLISNNGYLMHRETQKIRSGTDVRGYRRTMIGRPKVHVLIHRLVAEAFISNDENKRCVNHLNGIKHDNRMVNLEWCTHLENNKDAIDYGLRKKSQKGINNASAKITDGQVIDIRNKYLEGVKIKNISKLFGLHFSTIYHIVKYKSWTHLS